MVSLRWFVVRIMCVLLPHFPLRCELDKNLELKGNVIVAHEVGSQKLVLDYSPELEDLQCGMPLQEALARYGDAGIVHADISYYWSIFNRILGTLELKSPIVEGSELGLAYIGLDGLQMIYPTDDTLFNAVKEDIPSVFTYQMGIADGKFLAYLAARYSPIGGYRVLDGDVRSFLHNLPCDVLPLSLRSRKKLHEFGINTLRQIADLPAGPLQAQFGPEGNRIRRLAMGRDNTPLRPRFLEEAIEEDTTLLSVTVSLEAILTTVEALLARAFARNCLKGRGISRLILWTRTWDAVRWEHKINFKQPAMDIKSALLRIKPLMGNYPQPGPVEQVGIKITRLGYGVGRQKSIFSDVRAQDHLMEDIKQLELRLDSHQVYKVKDIEPWSRIPERRHALIPLNG